VTLNLVETSAVKSRPSVTHGANLFGNNIQAVFLPRDVMLAHYMLSSCVRPSVCLSATSMAKRRITQTAPYDSPETLVLSCQRSRRNSDGVTPYEGAK